MRRRQRLGAIESGLDDSIILNTKFLVQESVQVPRINGHFSIQNRHFSGEILHSFCIFSRKNREKLVFILQFAVLEREPRIEMVHCDRLHHSIPQKH